MEQNQPVQEQQMLPKSLAVMIIGIASIPFSFVYGIPGLVLAIIALILAGSGGRALEANPALYTPGSISMRRAGKICGVIGLILSIIMTIVWAIIIFLIAGAATYGHYNYNSF
jgi:hypothetical protein